MGWSLSSLQEMMKAEVAQPYIEDGSIQETAQLLLDAQAGIVEQWKSCVWPPSQLPKTAGGRTV